jgi:hypothetical protein
LPDDIKALAFDDPDDLTLPELLGAISVHSGNPLVFHYEGRAVKPGYHVTEVKIGQFAGLDCGANREGWSEVFVQLWDVDDGERTPMPAGKFARIIGKVCEQIAVDPGAKLTFEVSDGAAAIGLYRAAAPTVENGQVHLSLSARPASCKPRDRWLDEQQRSTSCCSTSAEPCCG